MCRHEIKWFKSYLLKLATDGESYHPHATKKKVGTGQFNEFSVPHSQNYKLNHRSNNQPSKPVFTEEHVR